MIPIWLLWSAGMVGVVLCLWGLYDWQHGKREYLRAQEREGLCCIRGGAMLLFFVLLGVIINLIPTSKDATLDTGRLAIKNPIVIGSIGLNRR